MAEVALPSCYLAREMGIKTCQECWAFLGCDRIKLAIPQMKVTSNV